MHLVSLNYFTLFLNIYLYWVYIYRVFIAILFMGFWCLEHSFESIHHYTLLGVCIGGKGLLLELWEVMMPEPTEKLCKELPKNLWVNTQLSNYTWALDENYIRVKMPAHSDPQVFLLKGILLVPESITASFGHWGPLPLIAGGAWRGAQRLVPHQICLAVDS